MRRLVRSGDVYAERIGTRIIRVDLDRLNSIGKPVAVSEAGAS
ncbi:MAG: hypothetical protein ACQEWM_12185 [Actinomycetota bacterium]